MLVSDFAEKNTMFMQQWTLIEYNVKYLGRTSGIYARSLSIFHKSSCDAQLKKSELRSLLVTDFGTAAALSEHRTTKFTSRLEQPDKYWSFLFIAYFLR